MYELNKDTEPVYEIEIVEGDREFVRERIEQLINEGWEQMSWRWLPPNPRRREWSSQFCFIMKREKQLEHD